MDQPSKRRWPEGVYEAIESRKRRYAEHQTLIARAKARGKRRKDRYSCPACGARHWSYEPHQWPEDAPRSRIWAKDWHHVIERERPWGWRTKQKLERKRLLAERRHRQREIKTYRRLCAIYLREKYRALRAGRACTLDPPPLPDVERHELRGLPLIRKQLNPPRSRKGSSGPSPPDKRRTD